MQYICPFQVQIFWKDHKNLAHLPLFLTSNYKWKIGQIFEAFSEYLNFKKTWTALVCSIGYARLQICYKIQTRKREKVKKEKKVV